MIELAAMGQGAVLGLSAAAAPGPLQALLVARAVRAGPVRSLPLALVPLASDAPAMAVVLLLLAQLPPALVTALRAAGVAVMLALAVATVRAARRAPAAAEPAGEAPRGFLEAGLVNLTNPNMWIFWSVMGGPILAAAWRASPGRALAFLAGFYACIIAGNAAFLVVAGGIARAGPRARRALGIASGVALACFAGWQAALLLRG